jgi:hypothetical protein
MVPPGDSGRKLVDAKDCVVFQGPWRLWCSRENFLRMIEILIENLRRFVMDEVGVEIPKIFRLSLHDERMQADG